MKVIRKYQYKRKAVNLIGIFYFNAMKDWRVRDVYIPFFLNSLISSYIGNFFTSTPVLVTISNGESIQNVIAPIQDGVVKPFICIVHCVKDYAVHLSYFLQYKSIQKV